MTNEDMTWEEWVEELALASGGQVDYWLVDEETAKIKHPELYEYYRIGYDVNDLVSERLISYERGDVVVWLDPDDREAELTFYAPVSVAALAEAFDELKIEIEDEYGSKLSLKEYNLLDDGSVRLTINYSSEIPNGSRFIEESLRQKTDELEKQIRFLEGKLESKESEVERLERLLSVPKFQVQIGDNNSMTDNRTINTGGGNYYESINTNGGNYIQGNYIDMSQDLAQAAIQIQEVIEQLKKNGVAVEVAQEQVVQDIAKQSQENPKKEGNLLKWGQSLGNATLSDVVTSVIKLALRSAGIPLP